MSILNSQPSFLLNSLEHFGQQSLELTRNELIELFCEQVIPFLEESPLIEALRKDWQAQQDRMHQKVQKTEERALKEVKEVFREIKAAIKRPSSPEIKEKLKQIEDLISGNRILCGAPLYQNLYNKRGDLLFVLKSV